MAGEGVALELEDLLDLAAFRTLSGGGSVFALEPGRMPDSILAATYRY